MNCSHLLWDFNGTILDDVVTGMESINAMLQKRGLPPLLTRRDYFSHFRFPIIEYYRSVGFDFEKESFETLTVEWVENYLACVSSAPLCPHAEEMLGYIKKTLHLPQILFSATESEMLTRQLNDLHLTGYFDEILGTNNIYALNKAELGRAWIARVHPKNALLIGDTRQDAQVARELGIGCVLVAQGHQSPETLPECGVPVLKDLSELPAFLAKEYANAVMIPQ
jgi:phosphoglycolate phosphatase